MKCDYCHGEFKPGDVCSARTSRIGGMGLLKCEVAPEPLVTPEVELAALRNRIEAEVRQLGRAAESYKAVHNTLLASIMMQHADRLLAILEKS